MTDHECVFVEEQEPSGRLVLPPCLTCGLTAMDALETLTAGVNDGSGYLFPDGADDAPNKSKGDAGPIHPASRPAPAVNPCPRRQCRGRLHHSRVVHWFGGGVASVNCDKHPHCAWPVGYVGDCPVCDRQREGVSTVWQTLTRLPKVSPPEDAALRDALMAWDFGHEKMRPKVWVDNHWRNECRCGKTYRTLQEWEDHRFDEGVRMMREAGVP